MFKPRTPGDYYRSYLLAEGPLKDRRIITYDDIVKMVHRYFGYEYSSTNHNSRKREIVRLKQLSVYLGKKYIKGISLSKLALPFKQNHATALHHITAIKNFIETKDSVIDDLYEIEKKINENYNCK